MVKLLHTTAIRAIPKVPIVKLLYVPSPPPKIKRMQLEIEKLKLEIVKLNARLQGQQDDGR
jgi:hypothetical protein